MTPDEFFSLPPAIALRLLFDSLDEETSANLLAREKPAAPRSPKYDLPIYRSGGIQHASETDLDGLRYWHRKATESAASGGQYAEKDKKKAENLARWIAWREWYPDAVWSGERNHEQVVAMPPSAHPVVHPSQRRPGAPKPQTRTEPEIDPDSDIPF